MTGSLWRIGGEGASELYGGKTAGGQRVRVQVSESGRGSCRREAEQAFRGEVWLLSSIHHRNLQELHSCSLAPGKLYLIFEYPEQGSLWGLLRGSPQCLTWSRRLSIALSAALGLDYLHSQIHPPVVHRDVKSRSILVTPEFQAKVGAAGLGALEFGDDGSLGYADPNRGEQGTPTTKCDVYAFGVVLLELATGLRPVEGEEHILSRALKMVASEEELELGIPAELRAEREKAVEGKPEKAVEGEIEVTLEGEREEGVAGERQQAVQGEGEEAVEGKDGEQACITEMGGTHTLTLEAFRCFLELGISCCAFKPNDRPSTAQVASTIEELLHGESLPVAPFRAPGQVPFPEYAEPIRGPMGPTELLGGISFTEDCPPESSSGRRGESTSSQPEFTAISVSASESS